MRQFSVYSHIPNLFVELLIESRTLVVQTLVGPELPFHEPALLWPTGNAYDLLGAFYLGELADDASDRAGGTGDENGFAWLEAGDVEQALSRARPVSPR